MPMMPQQQMPMQSGGKPQMQQQNSDSYPANPKEIEQVKTNAVKLIYSQGIREMITKTLTIEDPDKLTKSLAAITAKVLHTLATDIPQKTGRKPKLSMVIHMAKFILGEIKLIANKLKVKLPDQVIQRAGVMSGDILDQTFSRMSQQKRQGAAQPGQQPPPGAVPPQSMPPQQMQRPMPQPMQQEPQGLLGAAIPRG